MKVEQYFEALGLSPIPYGQTDFDTMVPPHHLLEDKQFGSMRIIYDTILRSRMGIPAISAGLCQRLYSEVETRVKNRQVFGRSLFEYDQIQYRLSALRGRYQICHAIWNFTGRWMDQHADVSKDSSLVNACKTLASEAMQVSADSALQIFAASGYQKNHIAGLSFVNARPFQIFEGTNDVLYENIFDAIYKDHKTVNEEALCGELEKFGLKLVSEFPLGGLHKMASPVELSQREKIHAGKLIAWAFVMGILEQAMKHNGPWCEQAWQLAQLEVHGVSALTPFIKQMSP